MIVKELLVCAALIFGTVVCPPVQPSGSEAKKAEETHQTVNQTLEQDPILALEYNKYLKEVVNLLESDSAFKKMIENATADDIKSGKIANQLQFVDHNIRTKLDELKRQEVDRLRELITRRAKLHNLKPQDIEGLLPKHLDHNNIETFEENDLEKLIKQATTDLEENDRIRREEFKEHEIEKEFERRKHLETMDEKSRKEAEEQHARILEQRKHHERVNHPGSADQLKEVWEEQDQLDADNFNPHTFFKLHDMDDNNYLDEFELESLFQIELDKIYNKSVNPEYDQTERDEEMNRMREHVMREMDKNHDMMISMDEFIDATKQREFNKNEEWKSLEDEPQYNQEEFDSYSRAHEEHIPTVPTLHDNADSNQHARVQEHLPNQQQQQAHPQQQRQNQPQGGARL